MKTMLISYTDLLFSIRRVNQSTKKIFLKVLKRMFLSFERRSVIVSSVFFKTNSMQDGLKQALIVGNNCIYSV